MSSSRLLRLTLTTVAAAAAASTLLISSASPLAIARAASPDAKPLLLHGVIRSSGLLAAPAPSLDDADPVITVPSDFSVEATGFLTNVSYSASIVDDTDPSPVLVCAPPSGGAFPIGQTTVTCNGHDHTGNSATPKTFKITVADTTAPVMSNVPGNIRVTSHDLDGVAVSYATPTASDAVDGSVPVDCDPHAGTTFPIGRFVVTCTATDSHNQTSSQTFAVIVNYAPLGDPRPAVPDPVASGPRSATPDSTTAFGSRPAFPGP